MHSTPFKTWPIQIGPRFCFRGFGFSVGFFSPQVPKRSWALKSFAKLGWGFAAASSDVIVSWGQLFNAVFAAMDRLLYVLISCRPLYSFQSQVVLNCLIAATVTVTAVAAFA